MYGTADTKRKRVSERASAQPQMVRVAARGKQSHQSAPRVEREHGTGTKNRFVAGVCDGELRATLTSGRTVEMAAQMVREVTKRKINCLNFNYIHKAGFRSNGEKMLRQVTRFQVFLPEGTMAA